jgi:PncC family amidohydrolase
VSDGGGAAAAQQGREARQLGSGRMSTAPEMDNGVTGRPLVRLAEQAGWLLKSHGMTLAVAESCTGGWLGSLITDVAGSSEYFLGGIIAYAYSVKETVLGVDHDTLLQHGAVSAETAVEMARRARRLVGADVGVSITGVAGPGGGSPGKPVGLVHLCVSGPRGDVSERHVWNAGRIANKELSAEAALQMLLRYLGEPA